MEAQRLVWVDGVVVVHPGLQQLKDGSGIRQDGELQVVTAEGVHEGLGNALLCEDRTGVKHNRGPRAVAVL